MQIHFLDKDQQEEALSQSKILAIIEAPDSSQRTHVIEFGGQDLLMVSAGGSDQAMVIYPDSSFDDELGGSLHDEARRQAMSADGAGR